MTGSRVADVPIADLERALHEACGITLSETVRGTLCDAFVLAARGAGLSESEFLSALRSRSPGAVGALVEFAVIGETYFFRHPEQIEALSSLLFQKASLDAPLSIWSAGCATGEEPYTLAMALLEAGRALVPDRILATDVSSRALRIAHDAAYGEWSLRSLDRRTCSRHFDGSPPRLTVRPEVRHRVQFARHNLVRDPPPGAGFDVVVCRNVLIYFTADVARQVASRLASALKPGGYLVLAPVEVPFADRLAVEPVDCRGATILRRLADVRSADERRATTRSRRGEPRQKGRPVQHDAAARLAAAAQRAPEPPASGRRVVEPPAVPAQPPELPPAKPTPVPGSAADLANALAAARRGDLREAERIAREAGSQRMCPESWLLVSVAAEARGDVETAIEAARRALYLDPDLAMAHGALVALYTRAGRREEAARARRNALEAIRHLDDAAPLRGVEPITAGALRSALGPRGETVRKTRRGAGGSR